MLVIAARADGDVLSWRGRRHDDDGPGAVAGSSVQDLFEAVFAALHDGEQVAVGFPAPLWTTGDAAPEPGDQVTAMAALVTEIGRWRPWTVVSTSLPRWRATTSVLVWETDLEADAAVEAFFALVRAHADHGAEVRDGDVLNLAASAAVRSELQADEAQLREPVLLVSAGAVSSVSSA